jgi:tetratricopeptide (TPR) repeat protein
VTGSPPKPVSERIPAAVTRFWGEGNPLALPSLPRALASVPGLEAVAPGVLVVLPSAGDAAIFDAALQLARAVLRRASHAGLRALIFPADAWFEEGALRLASDELSQDLDRQPPQLPRRAVALTTSAVHSLERAQQIWPRSEYAGASGRRVPLARAGLRRAGGGPRPRNPQIFGRPTRWIARPGPEGELAAAWSAPVLRIAGGLGAGKTRLVAEALARRSETALWVDLGASRAALRPSLVAQIFSQASLLAGPGARRQWAQDRHEWHELLALRNAPRGFAERLALATWAWLPRHAGPLRLIVDGVEGASPGERALLARLGELPQVGRSLRLVLIGRRGQWEEGWSGAPEVTVEPLLDAEASSLAAQLTHALRLPDEVAERLVQAAAGNPFALEEGVLQLIHRGLLRRVYGNFFYAGERSVAFAPTPRLVRHVRAEADRLGATEALRRLAAAGRALPAVDLADGGDGWEAPALHAGWIGETPTPWGAGVDWRQPFVAACLLEPLAAGEADRLRIELGERLASAGAQGERGWELYRLVAGSPLAGQTLLAAARLAPGERPRRELIAAFAEELRRLRERGGSAEEEFALLWSLLPLAHRLDALGEVRAELARAIALAEGQEEKLQALTALRAELEEREGRFDRAGASLRQALESAVAREGDADRKVLLSIRLGRILMREERFSDSRQLFERILPFLEHTGRSNLAASCHFYLGNIALAEHRAEEASAHHQAALEARRKKGKPGDKAIVASLSALGTVAIAAGNYPAALARYREAHALLEAGARGVDLAYVLLGLGRALARLGDFVGATTHLRRVVALREGGGDSPGEAIARLVLGEALLQMDQVAAALREARQAHFLLSLSTESRHLADAELLLGRGLLRQNQLDEAASHLASARRIHGARRDAAAVAWDLGWQLALEIQAQREGDLLTLGGELDRYLQDHPYPELGEVLDLHLFRALEWLHREDGEVDDALRYLRRGYRNLLRKTAYLEPGSRHSFLFQVPQNRDLLAAATRHGLSLPPPD